MPLVAASLLTDVRLLGQDSVDANAIAFHLNEPERAAVWIAERVRDSRLGNRMWDGVERDIGQGIARVNYDLGTLVTELCTLHEQEDSQHDLVTDDHSWVPWTVFAHENRGVRRRYEGPPLADGHLHSGAALDDLQFLRLLVSAERSAPSVPRTILTKDPGGIEYDLKVLVHAVRHYVRSLSFSDGLVADWGGGPAYWARVRRLLLAETTQTDSSSDLWLNFGPADPDESLRSIRLMLRDPHDPNQVSLATALLLISHAIRSREFETLGTFVDRFDQVGLLRDSALDSSRARVVERSCANIFSSSHVHAAEFRKTITVGRRPFSSITAIRKSLIDHLEGCGLFRHRSGQTVRFAVPFCFLRDCENGSAGPDELVSHYRLVDACAVASGIVSFLSDHPGAAKYIAGVDVVGNELNTSNWPFVVLFKEMQQRCALPLSGYSAHAGEFFRYRLQGLRSIGELILPDRCVARIGHGLALSDSYRPVVDLPSLTYREVLEDLLWLIGTGVGDTDSLRWLGRLLVGSRVASIVPREEDWIDAWRARRTWQGIQAAGLVGPDPFASTDWPAERIMVRSLREEDLATRRALMLLIYRGSGAANYIDQPVGRDFLRVYLEWARSVDCSVAADLGEQMAAQGVVVEACPTSNLRLSSLRGYEEHPLPDLLSLGLSVTLNSDDPLLFGTNVAREAQIVRAFFGEDVLDRVANASVNSCCPEVAIDACDPPVVARFLRMHFGHEGELWASVRAAGMASG